MSKEQSPLLLKYLKQYESNPRSRVFAPLAESYRKIGMVDRAMDVLKEGIRFHPSYVMGYLGLAFCYRDLNQYPMAYATVRPLIESNRDNLRMQKLFAEICEEIGHYDEALETYKYLLFVNPKDAAVSESVKRLEDSSKVETAIIKDSSAESPSFEVDALVGAPDESNIDEWTQVDFGQSNNEEEDFSQWEEQDIDSIETEVVPEEPVKVLDEQRTVKKQEEQHVPKVEVASEPVSVDELEEEAVPDDEDVDDFEDIPVVTHTLVDIYLAQGHIEKAYDVISKIAELNPNDERTIKKLAEVKQVLDSSNIEEEASEDEGHGNLMSILDSKLGKDDVDYRHQELEDKLENFLSKIKDRAQHVKACHK